MKILGIHPARILTGAATLSLLGLPLLATPSAAVAQDPLFLVEGTSSRPIPCWTTNMEFHDPQAFPYFEVEGYYFDANPFLTKRFIQRDQMLMRSSRGASLTDMSGRKIWSPTNIIVNCIEVTFFFGLYSQSYAIVTSILGTVTNKSLACSEDGGTDTGFGTASVNYASAEYELYDPYDPYDPYAPDEPSGCEDGAGGAGGGGGTGNSGLNCHIEFIVVEISYDAGLTWETWWEGYARVCE